MQHAQAVSLPAHYQELSDNAKLYEPGECYADFVRSLPKNLRKEHLHSDSISSDNPRYQPPRTFFGTLFWLRLARLELDFTSLLELFPELIPNIFKNGSSFSEGCQ